MNNRLIGNHFEQQLCEILKRYGFWTHNMVQNKSGQPADIIAVNKYNAILIDAKVCKNDRFSLSRIEDNQYLAMSYWCTMTECPCGFACYLEKSDKIYFVEYTEAYAMMRHDVKAIKPMDWKGYRTLKEFLELYT